MFTPGFLWCQQKSQVAENLDCFLLWLNEKKTLVHNVVTKLSKRNNDEIFANLHDNQPKKKWWRGEKKKQRKRIEFHERKEHSALSFPSFFLYSRYRDDLECWNSRVSGQGTIQDNYGRPLMNPNPFSILFCSFYKQTFQLSSLLPHFFLTFFFSLLYGRIQKEEGTRRRMKDW